MPELRRPGLTGVAAVAAALLLVPAASPALDYATVDSLFQAHYEIWPTDTPGNGFKPYQRFRWFQGPRVYPGRSFDADAYIAAWREVSAQKATMARGSETWFPMGPTNLSGRMKVVVIDPTDSNVLYAGAASGGVWKSTNAGLSWFALDDDLPSLAVGGLAIDPDDPDVIYLGSGEGHFNADAVMGVGILKSTDAGASWQATGLSWELADGNAVNALRYDTVNDVLMAATTEGVFRSDDGGGSFDLVLDGTAMDIEIRSDDPTRMFATLGNPFGSGLNGLYVSDDGGLSFALVEDPVFPESGVGRCMIDICDGTPTTMYYSISGTFGFNGTALVGVYRSTDGGATWELRATSPNFYNQQGWYDNTLDAHPTDPDIVYAGGVHIYRSLDGGATFAQISNTSGVNEVHVDQHGWAFDPVDPSIVYAACDGGIYRSTNGGSAWTYRSTDLATYQFYAMGQSLSNPLLTMGGTQDNGSNLYTGSEDTWDHVLGGDGGYCIIDYTDEDNIYAEWQYGNLRKSTNQGGSWSDFDVGILEDGAWVTPIVIHPTDPDIFYTVTRYVYKTTNASFWNRVSSSISGSAMIAMDISRSDPEYVYVVGNARSVFVSDDDGATWVPASVAGLPSRKCSSIAIHPSSPTTAVITFFGYGTPHVFRTDDAGGSWTDISGNLPDLPVNVVKFDPALGNNLYVGTDLGVYRTTDGGATWEPFSNGLPNVVVNDLRIHPDARLLRAATHGRGMWEVELGEVVAVEPDAIHPEPMYVSSRYPNPLRGATVFRFGLQDRTDVTLAVYDVRGREVAVLHEGELPPGIHQASWNADVPDGVYFLRLASADHGVSRKVVVQR